MLVLKLALLPQKTQTRFAVQPLKVVYTYPVCGLVVRPTFLLLVMVTPTGPLTAFISQSQEFSTSIACSRLVQSGNNEAVYLKDKASGTWTRVRLSDRDATDNVTPPQSGKFIEVREVEVQPAGAGRGPEKAGAGATEGAKAIEKAKKAVDSSASSAVAAGDAASPRPAVSAAPTDPSGWELLAGGTFGLYYCKEQRALFLTGDLAQTIPMLVLKLALLPQKTQTRFAVQPLKVVYTYPVCGLVVRPTFLLLVMVTPTGPLTAFISQSQEFSTSIACSRLVQSGNNEAVYLKDKASGTWTRVRLSDRDATDNVTPPQSGKFIEVREVEVQPAGAGRGPEKAGAGATEGAKAMEKAKKAVDSSASSAVAAGDAASPRPAVSAAPPDEHQGPSPGQDPAPRAGNDADVTAACVPAEQTQPGALREAAPNPFAVSSVSMR
ncbi:hypothetical protein J8273_8971 [Carpediemonas membranifera]|uniref:Uncharacterized protein n=1 Tax=Carpediemonas membranifera TaxID=201153 RepID=A0A8J6APA0_9EUKA|nr:hypothetical protein J8273_8971 [Carpediemonas membranifera]|eukprot:KAG9389671.1 hypothetical protein J8273_8971 [Carpediemonas membranifera]